jgi:hypothetical protein
MVLMAAYETLHDCERAVGQLEGHTEEDAFRIHFVAPVALVRGVGHVLESMGGPRHTESKERTPCLLTGRKT